MPKVAMKKSLLSKSEDLDLVNKFSIVFTMAKERISIVSFNDMCRAAALLAVRTVQTQPTENGQSVQSFQGDIAVCQDEGCIRKCDLRS